MHLHLFGFVSLTSTYGSSLVWERRPAAMKSVRIDRQGGRAFYRLSFPRSAWECLQAGWARLL